MEEKEFVVNFYYYPKELIELDFDEKIKPGFRFSIWKDNSKYTAGEIIKLVDCLFINPGEKREAFIALMNTKITQNILEGDVLYIGSVFKKIGEMNIISTILR